MVEYTRISWNCYIESMSIRKSDHLFVYDGSLASTLEEMHLRIQILLEVLMPVQMIWFKIEKYAIIWLKFLE